MGYLSGFGSAGLTHKHPKHMLRAPMGKELGGTNQKNCARFARKWGHLDWQVLRAPKYVNPALGFG